MSDFGFRSLYPERAVMLAAELRNAGHRPELTLARSPDGKWIHFGLVKVKCDSATWERAMEAMYEKVKPEAAE